MTHKAKITDDEQVHSIIAMIDAYVDLLSPGGPTSAGTPLFKLNQTKLTLETFRLTQKQLLTDITADRLSEDYVNDLIFRPLSAAIDFARSDLEASTNDVKLINGVYSDGVLGESEDSVQDCVGLVQESTVTLERAQADLIQRQIDIDGQRRRLKAEQDDLANRLDLDKQINDSHQYTMPGKGTVQFETYHGGFVKKEDVICTIRFDQPIGPLDRGPGPTP